MKSSKLVLTGVGLLGVATAFGATKPNVLFISVDDLKPNLGCYGDSKAITPNIDRIANNGMVFTNNHCQYAICGPTRASLLSGLRPDTIDVVSFKTKMRDLIPDLTTLPQHFMNNGYTSVGMGKIYDGRCCDGWDTQDRKSWSEPFIYSHAPKWLKPENEKNKILTECYDVPDNAYFDGDIADKGVKRLRDLAKSDKPFFFAFGM